jgi:cyclohexa-1,5-dienecarbonyl-CoA hydratase
MSETKIRTEELLGGAVLRVVLDAPKGNVLDGVMMRSLTALLDQLRGKPDVKLLWFTGEGDHFSFGASVPDHVREKAPAMLEAFHGLFLRLADLACVTAATVRGRCLGGGMELATYCHRVVAHPKALLGQPEIQLAVLPPVASLVLPFRVGQAHADDLCLTGRTVPADEALAMGLVDEVAEDPEGALLAWAERELLPKSATALRHAVRAARWRFHQTLRTELKAVERMYLDELMATHDANEGLAAFLEKRPAKYTNA